MYIIVAMMLIGVSNLFAQAPDSSWIQTESIDDFDSLNVRLVGDWPFSDSRSVAYDAVRQTVFLGSGGGVYIVDISNPSIPVQISDIIQTRGYTYGLFYDNNSQRLYIATEAVGIEIWDVSNLTTPVKLGYYDTPGWPRGIFVSGIYAYVADYAGDWRGALRIIDISSPTNPQEIGSYNQIDIQDVFISGSNAYIAAGYNGLEVIDITVPTNPQRIGYCTTPHYARGVFVSGFHVYIADCDLNNVGSLHVIDISNPSNPQEVGYCSTPWHSYQVSVSGPYAYVAATYSGLRIIDISNPSNPQEVGFYTPPDALWDITISGIYAFAANNIYGLRIVDVSNPSYPQEIGNHEARSSVLGIYPMGSYAYVANRGTGFRVIDISDLTNPTEIGHCDTPDDAFDVFTSGSYAYIAAQSAGLRVIDISNPSDPQEIGYCDTPGKARGVYVSGTHAYIADSSAGLRVIDISIPANPQEVGYCTTVDIADDIFVSGNHAYVADRAGGLRIIDVSTPSNPQEVGFYTGPGEAWGVSVQGSYAYVAYFTAGLRVIDVSNPVNPYQVGYCDTPDRALEVAVIEHYAYVADHKRGVRVIDILSPSNPHETGYYETNYYPYNNFTVAASDRYIYLGTYRAGFHIYENLEFHIVSDDPLALAYNNNKHLQREPNSDHLHIVYTSAGKVLYRYSDDGGDNWTTAEEIDDGNFPAIDLNANNEPCITWTNGNNLYYTRKDPIYGWQTTEYGFGVMQPTHPCISLVPNDEIESDSVHILVRSYNALFSTNTITEISFLDITPQNYQTLIVDQSFGIDMVVLDFPSIKEDYAGTLHACWMHGDTVYYGLRSHLQTGWSIWQNPFEPVGRNSNHPFVETYGDSIFVVWQNDSDDEVWRGRRHLGDIFYWENLSETPTMLSCYPVNASGLVTTFADKASGLADYDIFWKTYPGQPLNNLSNTLLLRSLYPQTSLRIFDEEDLFIQYTIWQEGNTSPYKIQSAKTVIDYPSAPAYFTTTPGLEKPSLHIIQRDSFISNWQFPVDIGGSMLTYEFPLDPNYLYKLKAIAYQEKQDKWVTSVLIDDKDVYQITYQAFKPETLEIEINPDWYADSIIEVTFKRKDGSFAAIGPIHVYRYEGESKSTKNNIPGGPMAQEKNTLRRELISISPNPFKHCQYIKIHNQVDFDICINIYDITGRLVKKLHNGKTDKGISLQWHGNDDNEREVSQGIYFMFIENPTTGETVCRKIVKIE
jgi:hypothetical protein